MTFAPGKEAPAPARLTVDLDALADNWRLLATASGPAETAAAVKADAYGTGLAPAATALHRAGCRTFFVALPAEGLALRAALPEATIYVLGGYLGRAAGLYRRHRLQPVLGDMAEIDEWLADAGADAPAPAIHVDTGINRLGLPVGAARALSGDHERMAALAPALVMSHFACADDPGHPLNGRQVACFSEVRGWFPGVAASLANSAGIGFGAAARFDLTRPGISLYGGRARERDDHPVRPVITLTAEVLTVREVPAGESVGYGATATVSRPSRVAIVSLGYADGYPRRLASDGAEAAVRGRRFPLIGRVSMDLLAVDVTDGPDVRRGDRAELIGPAVPLAEVADRAGTIGYEILTSLGCRFERRYEGG